MELLYLNANRGVEKWKRPPREWREAKAQFAILFGDRFAVRCTKPTSRTKLLIGPARTARGGVLASRWPMSGDYRSRT